MPNFLAHVFNAAMVTNKTAAINILCIAILFILSHTIDAQNKPLFLSCGSPTPARDADGRSWDPDDKYLVAGAKFVVAKAGVQDPALPSEVPYMTARIFQSEAKYQFPLQNSSSRTLLRLHFYPSSYPNFNISNSYFGVVAGGVTLLSNFSASISAEALSQAYFIKEFYLTPSQSPTLEVTFRPSDQSSSFAFVNGIEVISTPPIFDTDPAVAGTVGTGGDLMSATVMPISGSSMEAMFRLNVGGKYIPPVNDSDGLMRSWYDDSVYISGAGHGVANPAHNATVSYKGMPSYMAPLDVYTTYRSLGAYKDLNKNANLTWVFHVDPNFMYLLRFHWCDSEMTRVNQRVFDVFINNRTAASEVDVFGLAHNAIATPIKMDFVARVNADAQLWVALRPTDKTKPEYIDILLNGLEIFKLSDTAKANLAGPNPTISDMMRKYQESHIAPASFASHDSGVATVVITGAAGGACIVGLAFVVCLFAYKRKERDPNNVEGTVTWLPISWNSSTSTTIKSSVSGRSQGGTAISSDAACNCRYFSLTEIRSATKNFDESNVIGVGGFGKVYKGVIDGNTKVAIKRSNPSSDQGINEFQTEIEMLSRLRHRHLVSLIGFCEDNGEMILVYDYMGQGTLREHLYKGNKVILSWKQRLEICIGAARGLHYLHTGARYTIIHRDVKTTNILLDEKWVAKMSDFGLSKTGPDMNKGHVSTVVKGSFGYLDPEYFRRQQLTEKSDVYSFGVVLFEVLCARPALNPNLPKEQVSLADWALRCARDGTLEEIIDPQLKGKVSGESLKKFMETAEKCLADHGTDRPSMGDVLWNLEFALQLHDNPDNKRDGGSSITGSVDFENLQGKVDQNSIMAMHRSILNLDDEDDDDDEEARKEDSSDDQIFSQIVNPQAR